MNESYLAELEALSTRATQGPWLEREDYDYYQGGTYLHYGKTDVCRVESGDDDKRFIAASREALPRLIAELREARALLGILKWERDNVWASYPEEMHQLKTNYEYFKKHNARYREALEWYADCDDCSDRGERARAALGKEA